MLPRSEGRVGEARAQAQAQGSAYMLLNRNRDLNPLWVHCQKTPERDPSSPNRDPNPDPNPDPNLP